MDFFNGKGPNRGINPDEAVAYGAAIQGGVIEGETGNNDYVFSCYDYTPLSLGIETVGGLMSKIIQRGYIIPTRKSLVFTTNQDNQTQVNISLYQGERPMVKDNYYLGKIQIKDIPTAPRGTAQI